MTRESWAAMLRQKDAETPLRVSDLIEYLKRLPPDAAVVQSLDSEGNTFALTHELWDCYCDESGAIHTSGGSDNLRRAVCFWPAQ